jgi:squalene-hopene/tetraprenyl-beta-curcumene cyclase
MKRTIGALIAGLGLAMVLGISYTAGAADEPKPAPPVKAEAATATAETATADAKALAEKRKAAVAKAVAFILAKQNPNGSWGDEKAGIGVTGLATQALLFAGKTVKDEPVKKAVDLIVKTQKEDGGIYDDGGLANYCTCIAVQVLVKADKEAYAAPIKKAMAFLTKHQWDDVESVDKQEKADKNDPRFGGAGYGKSARPDLSNTQYFADALQAAGVPKDDPAWARMLVFVSRCQANSETNDSAVTKIVTTDDGGFVYSVAGGGESKANTVDLPDGRKGLRSYGSMTYAGFKSMLYASVSKDDPRVKAALAWIQKHWGFDENPEMGQSGLYYYYQTSAKALKAFGKKEVLDARQRPHDWRAEITESILKRQKDDGSWANPADRWFEGFPLVPTAYSVLALSDCE